MLTSAKIAASLILIAANGGLAHRELGPDTGYFEITGAKGQDKFEVRGKEAFRACPHGYESMSAVGQIGKNGSWRWQIRCWITESDALMAAPTGQLQFVSRHNFSLNYPKGWRANASDKVRFSAEYGPPREKAPGPVALRPGQANLVVWELGPGDDIHRQINHLEKTEDRILRKATYPSHSPAKNRCHEITEIDTEWEVGPGSQSEHIAPVYERDVYFFCQIGRRAFAAEVGYAIGDKAAERYRKTALRIMESVAVTQ